MLDGFRGAHRAAVSVGQPSGAVPESSNTNPSGLRNHEKSVGGTGIAIPKREEVARSAVAKGRSGTPRQLPPHTETRSARTRKPLVPTRCVVTSPRAALRRASVRTGKLILDP